MEDSVGCPSELSKEVSLEDRLLHFLVWFEGVSCSENKMSAILLMTILVGGVCY